MTEKELLLRELRQAFDEKSWHGTNLYGSIRGLKPDLAAWRPGPGRHNIWELILHAAYWKYAVVRRLTGEPKGSFVLKGSNFFERPADLSETALKEDVQILRSYHDKLLETVSRMKAKDLNGSPTGSTVSNRDIIMGVAAHDIYHAGQIQLLKRLYPGK